MKVGVCTLGCKVNLYESEFMISLLKNAGYEINSFDDINDIYIINTCTVTNNSDKKSRKMINQARKLNKDACVVVAGCFVESAKDYDFSNINIVIGNKNKSKIVDFLKEYFATKKNIDARENIFEASFEDMEIKTLDSRTRAFVKIQDGCENYCSYCIIPFVRGKQRSKSMETVLKEITSLVNNDYKEIVLTGIHTGSYGIDLGIKFSDLLKEILKIDKLKRLRISSIEVTELDDDFLEILKNPKICDHLHIPLQSGSDKILKLMNRKYDTAYFYEKLKKIREIRKDINITTDVIVGFPNELDEDFNTTLEFAKKCKFGKIHCFPYSKRNNTKAFLMDGHIDENVKKKRNQMLIRLSNILEEEYKSKFVGKTKEVLIEASDENYSYGHTSNYLYLKCPKNKENELLDVLITDESFKANNINQI